MKKLTALFVLLCSFHLLIACQAGIDPDALAFDPDIKHGKLTNGLQYYILNNRDPKDRVYIRLVVNAGSMHEDDDQKGIAHLVEHMAFNGSKKYPENTIINALEKLGMKFARDINAFTDFENTVYTLNLDGNSPQKLSLAFDVINEWMNHLTILPKDLDGERGVVQEEWRRRLSPMLRLGDKKSAIEMAGSRYVLRDPIGDMNIIRHISRDRVTDFYHKWYRPDNMSLIVVGDIDAHKIAQLISQQLDKPSSRTQRPLDKIDFSIPLIHHWRVASIAEQGTNIPALELSFFEEDKQKETVIGYKQDLIQQIVTRLVNLRLQKWEKSQNNWLDSANFYRSHLGKQTLQSVFSLQLIDTNYLKNITALFAFIAEIKQHGFTADELNGEIARLHNLNEKQQNIRPGSLKIANDLIAIAANHQIMLSAKERYNLNRRFLNEIKVTDLNATFNQMLALNAKLLLITQPLPEKKLPFDADYIEQRWNQAMHSGQNQWENKKHIVKQPHFEFKDGSLVLEKHWDKGDIDEFRLSNGAKLIYHYSNKTPNQVHFRAVTSGGLRSVPNQDYHLLRTAITLVDDTGTGELTQADVNNLFGQSPLVLATVIDDDKQGFTGVAKPQDLSSLLTLFRLKLQSAPVSDNVLQKYHRETQDYFKQIDAETKFMQSISYLRRPNTATVYTQNQNEQLSFTAAQLSQIYQEKILGKTDFTYFIIGDISRSEVEKLAKRYLATVEIKTQARAYQPGYIHTPKKAFIMRGLSEPRADVEIYLTAENQWHPEQKYALEILAEIIQEKLRLVLREKVSGIYSVNSWFSQDPHTPQIEGKIAFSCAPNRAEELIKLTHQILDEIIENGIDETLLRKKQAEQQQYIKRQFDSLVSVAGMIEDSYWQQSNPQSVYLYQRLEQIADKPHLEALARKVLVKAARFEAILRQ
ncbi:protease3 [Aggregatibacter actinomycetemcomitans]|uniref:M16 family metallopeptidase n=1 Tax=Aggregatibacter actinomycetemcomitans TaxID=714 RepID=UPI000D6E6178|nr:insulinase family protein [Aggregatibacter actinomycetemcomitans]SSY82183.1 protease3 [Aggregatibacter actinomycetemcomitans]